MRRLNKEVKSTIKLNTINGLLKMTNMPLFKKIHIVLLRKAMQGCEKSKKLLLISRKHAQQLENAHV